MLPAKLINYYLQKAKWEVLLHKAGVKSKEMPKHVQDSQYLADMKAI